MFWTDIFYKTEDWRRIILYSGQYGTLHFTKINEYITHFISKFLTKDKLIYSKHALKTYKYHKTQLYEIHFYF
jgi:hypothetical protein